MAKNWDTETADNCRLPQLINNICEGCRDYKYCYRQMIFDDMKEEWRRTDGKIGEPVAAGRETISNVYDHRRMVRTA